MKIKIDVDPEIMEPEIIVRCKSVDESIIKLQKYISGINQTGDGIVFYQNETEFYFPVESVLFFETTSRGIMAHTESEEFFVKFKLYELEEMLPDSFLRVSKSTIVNVRKIYSIRKNLTGASLVEFMKTSKVIYVSRNYYQMLKEKLISVSLKPEN